MAGSFASSSSSSNRIVRFDPVRTDEDEDEDDSANSDGMAALEALRAELPADWQPPGWCRRYTREEDLVDALESLLGLAAPDAIDAVREYGLAACEGALLRTMTYLAQVRKPRGWYVTTLRRGLAWTTAEVELYVRREWERVVRRLEASGNPQQERVAEMLRQRAGWGGKVMELRRMG